MRIDILAIGSRGDVQPYVALGLGLQKAGHRPRIVTLDGFAELVRACGLDHLAIGVSPRDIADTAAGRDWIAHRDSTLGFLRGFVRIANSLIEEGIVSYWHACRNVEALIVSPMGLLIGAHIAERLRVPLIRTEYSPHHGWESRENLKAAVRGGWDAFLGTVFHFLLWSKLRRSTNIARQRVLGLPPLSLRGPLAMERQRIPLLEMYSPAIVPRPSHWGDWIHVTGYWFLDDLAGWEPSGELVDFLGSGPPPVFVGFGSIPFPAPEAATRLVVRALARAGQRGILVAGGSSFATGRLNDEVLSVDFAPYAWLFPQVCAAVHQGGAGVTSLALRAGLPSVTIPVFGDHPFWAQQVFKLGAGARPIPAKQLTEDALVNAIRATAGKEMRRRAAALGEQIRAEDGVARAVEAIHAHLAERGTWASCMSTG